MVVTGYSDEDQFLRGTTAVEVVDLTGAKECSPLPDLPVPLASAFGSFYPVFDVGVYNETAAVVVCGGLNGFKPSTQCYAYGYGLTPRV